MIRRGGLFGKLLKMARITIAIVVALGSVGIDPTALVFGGAIGVGIGFGLRKAVSNLVSGLILLLGKSIKPGARRSATQPKDWASAVVPADGGRTALCH